MLGSAGCDSLWSPFLLSRSCTASSAICGPQTTCNVQTGACEPTQCQHYSDTAVRITATGGVDSDHFGAALAISGAFLAVSAPGQSNARGAVYLFSTQAPFAQLQMVAASDAADRDTFGSAVALNTDTLIVGASAKKSTRGGAYVFQYDGQTWNERQSLDPDTGTELSVEGYGTSAALSGDLALIGAPFRDNAKGAVYVLSRSAGTFAQTDVLQPAALVGGDSFGSSVALSEASAVAGAPTALNNLGQVYAFGRSAGHLDLRATVPHPDSSAASLFFGIALAMAQDDFIAGEKGFVDSGGRQTGTAYLFTTRADLGAAVKQVAQLSAPSLMASSLLGSSVDFKSGQAVLGAPGLTPTSAAFLFSGSSGTLSLARTLLAPGPSSEHFGLQVALSGQLLAVAAPDADAGRGAVYVYPCADISQ